MMNEIAEAQAPQIPGGSQFHEEDSTLVAYIHVSKALRLGLIWVHSPQFAPY